MEKGIEVRKMLIDELIEKPTIESVKKNLINNIKFNWIEQRINFFRERKIQKYLNENLEKEYKKLLDKYNNNYDNNVDKPINKSIDCKEIESYELVSYRKIDKEKGYNNEIDIYEYDNDNVIKNDVHISIIGNENNILKKNKLELFIKERRVYDTIFSLGLYDDLYEDSEICLQDKDKYNSYYNQYINEDKYNINNILKYIDKKYIPVIEDNELDFNEETFQLMKLDYWELDKFATKKCIEELEYWYYYEYEDNEVFEEYDLRTVALNTLYSQSVNKLITIINDNALLKLYLNVENIDNLLSDKFTEIFDMIFDNYITYSEEDMILSTTDEKINFICQKYLEWLVETLRKDVVEQEYKRLLVNDKQEKEEIIKICKERKIDGLLHFTNVNNLESILMRGIIPVWLHEAAKINSEKNDIERRDNHLECTSFSIGFPNYKFFYSIRNNNSDKRFAVIKIKPSILWEKYRVFCIHNAADNRIICKDSLALSKASEFKSMFDDIETINRELLNIPDNYTTDPQAEVLVEGCIEVDYIDEIIFNNYDDLNKFKNCNYINNQIKLRVDNKYFSPRVDYIYWQS